NWHCPGKSVSRRHGLHMAPCLFGHRLAHAEVNALVSVDHAAVHARDCVLYTTLEPCALCVGAIRMLGLKDVRYAARDPVAGSLALFEATDFMRHSIDLVLGDLLARYHQRTATRPLRPLLPSSSPAHL